MKSSDVAVVTVGSVLVCVLLVVLASVIMQLCASQCYTLTQQLFPALNKARIEYWLDWGTLLGAKREGTMIPHDYDADIGMRESEFQKLKQEWNRNPAFKGMRLCKENSGLYRVRRGLGWVDVFRYDDNCDDSDALRMISMAGEQHSCKCDGKGHKTSRSTIFPTKHLRFGAVSAPAPQYTELYLEHLYGSDWVVPRTNSVAKLLSLVPLKKPHLHGDRRTNVNTDTNLSS